jgi:hypothetical protein
VVALTRPVRDLSAADTRRLLIAFGWTRGDRPFSEAEMVVAYAWAIDPTTPGRKLAAVLGGDMSIDVDGTAVLLGAHKRSDRRELKRALRRHDELFAGE